MSDNRTGRAGFYAELFTFGALVFAAAAASSAAAPAWHVWTETTTRRVLRSELPGKQLPVRLAAARNEWVGFQVLMRSASAVGGVRLVAGDLHGPDGATLHGADALLYRQHQLHITTGTYRNESFKPDWYPDPLIPDRHPLTGKPLTAGRWRAMPFDLPPDQTHGFWVDLYVPDGAAAGTYKGTYRLQGEGGAATEIPVELTVWGFSLPEVPALVTALGSPAARMRSYYRERARAGKEKEPEDWQAVELQCAELLSRHRINATPPAGSLTPRRQRDGSYHISDEQVERLRKFVDRWHVNAIQVPRPTGVVKDPQQQRDRLHAWLRAWDEAADRLQRPHVLFYTYLKDEPNDAEAYEFVRRWGSAIRQAHSVVKVLVVEQTRTQNEQWGDLYGAVDIWCALFPLFDPESAARRQALGEQIWCYTALCQQRPTPWWHIDYPLLNYRVPAWIAWRYRIRGLLYWGGMSYWRAVEDPWIDAGTYHGSGVYQHGKKGRVYNGEGTLVYPGRAVGFDGIVPSLRLKALRDAIEDYQYLSLLEQAGRAEEAQQIVLPLAGSWFQWEKDAAAYEQARRQLAERILQNR